MQKVPLIHSIQSLELTKTSHAADILTLASLSSESSFPTADSILRIYSAVCRNVF